MVIFQVRIKGVSLFQAPNTSSRKFRLQKEELLLQIHPSYTVHAARLGDKGNPHNTRRPPLQRKLTVDSIVQSFIVAYFFFFFRVSIYPKVRAGMGE